MIMACNFQLTSLSHEAQIISVGLSIRPTIDAPIHVFYGEYKGESRLYSDIDAEHDNWLLDNVYSKLWLDKTTSHMIPEITKSNDHIVTKYASGSIDYIGNKAYDWIHDIRSIYNLKDEPIEFLSDIPAYDKLMFGKLMDKDGLALSNDVNLLMMPYDICLNSEISYKMDMAFNEAFDINRYDILSSQRAAIYNSVTPENKRVTTQAFHNCIETLLLFEQLQEARVEN